MPSAKGDIFEVIENAILVAALDRPEDFAARRDGILENLFKSRSKPNREDSKKEAQTIIMALSKKNQDKAVLLDSLRRLQLMTISNETLMSSRLGISVSSLLDHHESKIRDLAQMVTNEWLRSLIASPGNSDSLENKSNLCNEGPPVDSIKNQNKMKDAKRKFQESYKEVQEKKKQRMTKLLEIHDLPKQIQCCNDSQRRRPPLWRRR